MSRSRRNSCADNSQEFVTNWPAVYGILVTMGLLVLGAGLWCWDVAHRQVARAPESTPQATITLAPRDVAERTTTFRRESIDAPVPKLDVEAIEADGRHAQRALVHMRSGILLTVATAPRGVDLADFVERVEIHNDALLKNPATITTIVSASGHYDYPRTQEDATLRYLVDEIPELDMQEDTTHFVKLAAEAKALTEKKEAVDEHAHANLLLARVLERPHLQGLPLMMGDDCRSDQELAIARNKLAFGVRATSRVIRGNSHGAALQLTEYDDASLEDFTKYLSAKMKEEDANLKAGKYVAIYEQMMQVESIAQRRVLINLLSKIEGHEASEAIARRALFDMDDTVRSVATEVLNDRDAREYEGVLQKGLNYPWSPVVARARHVQRSSKAGSKQMDDAKKELVKMVEDMQLVTVGHHASAPYQPEPGEWKVNELVKVNHLRNCVMCHQVSSNQEDPLRGQIPSPGERLPRIYYNSNRGHFVRADTVYLRQDFSAMLPVENADPWPAVQRFDFFVRTRNATGEDFERAYEQRRYNASLPLRFALRAMRQGLEWVQNQEVELANLFDTSPQAAQPKPLMHPADAYPGSERSWSSY